MILPHADWRSWPDLDRLVAALNGAAGATRYVGGAVRDTLLGLPVSDLDLATALLPGEVLGRLQAAGLKAVPTGLSHGTITAVLPAGPVEVTTLRQDVSTDGRRATVDFTDDWRTDAARRDFTINALSVEPAGGAVHDYFGGLADLAAGRVRFIGEPLARIAEDHLRILRFFRFHARFGRGAPDEAGLAACAARARDLMALSRERIAQELLKLLGGVDPVATLATMVEHGILRPILPEIGMDGIDRLARLVAREKEWPLADPLRRLAALLPPDRGRAEDVATRLRLATQQRQRLATMAAAAIDAPPRALAHRHGLAGARDLLLLRAGDEDLAPALLALDGWAVPKLPIGGGALVAMGLERGPEVAATLAAITRQWVAEDFPDEARVRAIAAQAVTQLCATRKA